MMFREHGYPAAAGLLVRGVDEYGHYLADRRPSAELGAHEMKTLCEAYSRPSGFGGGQIV